MRVLAYGILLLLLTAANSYAMAWMIDAYPKGEGPWWVGVTLYWMGFVGVATAVSAVVCVSWFFSDRIIPASVR